MDQASRPASDQESLPAPSPGRSPAPADQKRRAFPWGWVLVPLLLVGGGYIGYRLGRDDSGGAASAGGSFGGAGGGSAPGSGGAGGSQQGASAQGSGGQTQGSRAGAGQTGAGQAAGAAGAAGGTTGTAAGSGRSRGQAGGGTRGATGVVTPVQAAAVKEGTLSTQRRLTGTVSPSQQTSVVAQTAGTVTQIAVNVGGDVGAGQTVILLSNSDLNASVDSARNALETAQVQLRTQANDVQGQRAQLQQQVSAAQTTLNNAQQNLTAVQRLAAIGAASRTDVNTAVAQVEAARTTLTTAQANLADNVRAQTEGLAAARLAVQKAQITLNQAQATAANVRVSAPYAGQVTALNVSQGQYLSANSPAFSLVSSQRQVSVNVPATEAATLPVGAGLNFVIGQQTYPLKVAQNAGAAVGGSVPIVARFVGGAPPALGTVGSVVYTAKVASGVLVPSTALQVDGDRTYVFTVQGGKARQTAVTVLGQAGTQAAVSGVSAGSQIISEPPTGLLDGASVTTAGTGQGRSRSSGAGGPGAGGPPPGGAP